MNTHVHEEITQHAAHLCSVEVHEKQKPYSQFFQKKHNFYPAFIAMSQMFYIV